MVRNGREVNDGRYIVEEIDNFFFFSLDAAPCTDLGFKMVETKLEKNICAY